MVVEALPTTKKVELIANLNNGFIRPSKSHARAFIFFIKKLNGSLYLCVNY